MFLYTFSPPTERSRAVTKCTSTGHQMSGESNPPSKKECQWLITSSKDKGSVTLKFTAFDFSKSDPSCSKDFVEIRNGLTKHAPLIGKYCESKVPSPVQSSGNGLWVRYAVSGKIKTKVGMTYHDGPVKSYQGDEGGKGMSVVHLLKFDMLRVQLNFNVSFILLRKLFHSIPAFSTLHYNGHC